MYAAGSKPMLGRLSAVVEAVGETLPTMTRAADGAPAKVVLPAVGLDRSIRGWRKYFRGKVGIEGRGEGGGARREARPGRQARGSWTVGVVMAWRVNHGLHSWWWCCCCPPQSRLLADCASSGVVPAHRHLFCCCASPPSASVLLLCCPAMNTSGAAPSIGSLCRRRVRRRSATTESPPRWGVRRSQFRPPCRLAVWLWMVAVAGGGVLAGGHEPTRRPSHACGPWPRRPHLQEQGQHSSGAPPSLSVGLTAG